MYEFRDARNELQLSEDSPVAYLNADSTYCLVTGPAISSQKGMIIISS